MTVYRVEPTADSTVNVFSAEHQPLLTIDSGDTIVVRSLDAAAPDYQSPSADPELQATRRGAAMIVGAAARQAGAELRKAWRARREEAAGRGWRR